MAGINAKDTICLVLTGATGKSEDHRVASTELRRTGPLGAGCAKAVERARRLLAAAAQITAG